jgi:CRISPR/Cas system endoribonuclease Cas6 (RAMP superfamily)
MDGNFQLCRKPTANEKQGGEVLSPSPFSIFSSSADETALWGNNEETKKFDKKIDTQKEVSMHK